MRKTTAFDGSGCTVFAGVADRPARATCRLEAAPIAESVIQAC